METEDINNKISIAATMAYSTTNTVRSTYALANSVRHIDGCFVECGVAAGAQLIVMALLRSGKDIIGFDSFEGVPMAGEYDKAQPGIGEITHNVNAPIKERLVSSGQAVHTMDNVLNNFAQVGVGCPTLRLIKGWFQNTLPKFQPVPIALLRLDGDLYESTMVCLQYLYPMVSSGGVVIIDDYGLAGAHKAVHDYFGNNMPELVGSGVVHFYKP